MIKAKVALRNADRSISRHQPEWVRYLLLFATRSWFGQKIFFVSLVFLLTHIFYPTPRIRGQSHPRRRTITVNDGHDNEEIDMIEESSALWGFSPTPVVNDAPNGFVSGPPTTIVPKSTSLAPSSFQYFGHYNDDEVILILSGYPTLTPSMESTTDGESTNDDTTPSSTLVPTHQSSESPLNTDGGESDTLLPAPSTIPIQNDDNITASNYSSNNITTPTNTTLPLVGDNGTETAKTNDLTSVGIIDVNATANAQTTTKTTWGVYIRNDLMFITHAIVYSVGVLVFIGLLLLSVHTIFFSRTPIITDSEEMEEVDEEEQTTKKKKPKSIHQRSLTRDDERQAKLQNKDDAPESSLGTVLSIEENGQVFFDY